MNDERTPEQRAQGAYIKAYSLASAALGRAANTYAAHVAAQNDGTLEPECLALGRVREMAADDLEEACGLLRGAALNLHGYTKD